MWMGKSYQVYRHTGRMIQDDGMRMSNRAESGLGALSILGLIALIGAIVFMVMSK